MIIKYGFLIKDGEIYDTKIKSYKLDKKVCGENIIYFMTPSFYKRLYLYECLLFFYSIDKVFEILRFNSNLIKNRQSESLIKTNKLHYMANTATIYNYPPTFLTQKRYAIYKKCQKLKQRLD